jgi:hypothetical protein
MFRSLYSVYCLCVNVSCTAATGCQPNCGYTYHTISEKLRKSDEEGDGKLMYTKCASKRAGDLKVKTQECVYVLSINWREAEGSVVVAYNTAQ